MSENVSQSGGIKISMLFKGIGVSYLVTIPLFAVFSFILSRMEFPERYIDPAVLITTVVSILAAGIISSVNLRSRGWMNGAFVGLIYMLILYAASSIVYGSFPVNRHVVIMFVIGAITGAIGGIFGINMKRPRYGR
jgi:putative membrane protein (TIGR04086 family)